MDSQRNRINGTGGVSAGSSQCNEEQSQTEQTGPDDTSESPHQGVKTANTSFASGDRSVSEVLGVALLIGIVFLGISIVLLVGFSELTGTQETVEVAQAEQSLTQFDAEANRIATGSTAAQTVDLGLRGNSGTLDVNPESGRITIEYVDNIFRSNRTEVLNTSLGAVVYENSDTTVAYQGGGVWRSDGDGSTMVSPPEITFQEKTLTMPVIVSEQAGGVHSDVQLTAETVSEQKFPNATVIDRNLTNKVDTGTVWITIESEYALAWGQFFEDRTNAEVVYPRDGTVLIIFFGSSFDFSRNSGIIATSGPGEIRVEGSGSYIDSYNSTDGLYSETVAQNGSVKSAGSIDLFGGATIEGDAESNKKILLDGNSEITGDACAETIEGEEKIDGDTDCEPNVPILPPLNNYVEQRADQLRDRNDNNQTEFIEDESLVFENRNGRQVAELPPGEYYLEEIDIVDKTLILNASGGDIDIAVEKHVRVATEQGNQRSNVEIEGENDDGTVSVFLLSEGNLDIKVQGGGNFIADHFYVDGDSQVTVENNRSTRFQILAPSYFSGAVRGSNSVDPRVTGVVLAPTPGRGPSRFLVRDAELYGAVVTGNLSAENNAQIHFDRAILGEKIPFGEQSLLDYLYITKHVFEVRNS